MEVTHFLAIVDCLSSSICRAPFVSLSHAINVCDLAELYAIAALRVVSFNLLRTFMLTYGTTVSWHYTHHKLLVILTTKLM